MTEEIENLNMQYNMAQLVLKALNVTKSESEAADRLGISVRSMNRWKHKYKIKYYRPGSKYFIEIKTNENEKKFVVKRSQLPTKLPVALTISSFTALDHFKANALWWFVVCITLSVWWIHAINEYRSETEVALFEDGEADHILSNDGIVLSTEQQNKTDGYKS